MFDIQYIEKEDITVLKEVHRLALEKFTEIAKAQNGEGLDEVQQEVNVAYEKVQKAQGLKVKK